MPNYLARYHECKKVPWIVDWKTAMGENPVQAAIDHVESEGYDADNGVLIDVKDTETEEEHLVKVTTYIDGDIITTTEKEYEQS